MMTLDEKITRAIGIVFRANEAGDYRIGNKCFFAMHCGLRMIKVKVFAADIICLTHNHRPIGDIRVCACPDCKYSEQPLLSSQGVYWSEIISRGERPTIRPPHKQGEGFKPITAPPVYHKK